MNKHWYLDIFAIVFFIIVTVIAINLLQKYGWYHSVLDFGLFDFVVVSLAAFRILHLLSFDKIFAFVREYFDTRGKRESATGIHRYIDSLFDCLWCTGMWSGLIAVIVYSLGMWGHFAIYVLAAAGAASLLQVASLSLARKS